MARPTGDDVLGSGVSLPAYSALLAASVALFLFWGGPLWTQPREASHVMRFAVSYLAMIPLVAGLLRLLGRFDWPRLLTALGTLWGIKLVATSALYLALARGTAVRLEPAAAPRPSAPPAPALYEPAGGGFASGVVRGRLRGPAVDAAVVYVAAAAPGRAPDEGGEVAFTIAGARFDRPLYLARATDRLRVSNHDGRLHTFHVHRGAEPLANQPLPPDGRPQELPAPDPGEYHVRSDADPATETWLVVVDHPYAVETRGEFELAGVPAGAIRLVVVAARDGRLLRAERGIVLAAGATVDVELEPTLVVARSHP
jgi:hypothetical protein